jgi:YYY domain-containing protein
MIGAVAWRWALVLALGYVLFLPFHQHYAASYGGFTWWEGSRTPLSAYVTMHGLFLFLIGTYLALELAYGHGHNTLVRLLRAAVRNPSRLRRYRRLYRLLVRPSSGYILALRIGAFVLVADLILFSIGYGVVGLIVLLLALVVLLGLSLRPTPQRQFTLGLIALGLALTLVPETIVLAGDVGRMNTVFKFYLQVWIMWSVAAAAVFPWTVATLYRWGKLRWFWWSAFALLLMACLFYPLMAIPARVGDHFATSTGKTLDGTAYMQSAVYRDRDQDIALDWDRQAMAWLQEHVHGSPVIVEANTPLYRWGNRVATNTGLPAVIGWDWHQRQQRAVLPPDVVDRRLRDVQTIYNDQDPKLVSGLLHRYGVQYVYVGPLERLYYDAAGLDKFDQANGLYWNLIYENPGVKIYQTLYDMPG